MTWRKTAADRRRDQRVYGDPLYLKNRAIARQRANGTCEGCQHRHPKLECDHIVPKSAGQRVSNALSNLQMLCTGPGSCRCHDRKTYRQRDSPGVRKRAADPDPKPRTNW